MTAFCGRRGRKALVWAVVLSVGLFMTGCSKQRAGLAIKKASTNIKQAKSWNAEKYPESSSAYKSADSSLKSAESAMSGAQYSQALSQGQEAVRQSQDALKNAKSRFADEQLTQARKDVQVAQINDGQKENGKLYEAAQQKLQSAEQKYSKQKYEDAIDLSSQVINTVDQLLAHLKNQSNNNLTELRARYKELVDNKAEEFYANSVIKTSESITRITDKIQKDRDYKQASLMAGTAIADAVAGITETKKRRSNLEMQQLESKISEAIAEEAPIYANDDLKTVQESFEEILKNYYDNQFDTVLQAADMLKPKVVNLILKTRIEATKDKIDNVEKAIVQLKEQAIETYLPGQIKVMDDLVAQAHDFFNNADYDSAKERASQALVEQDRIIARFDSLAEKTHQQASSEFSTSQKTYERMAAIFGDVQTPRTVDKRVDARRQTETAYLANSIAKASEQLQMSQMNRTQKEFRKSIEQAKAVQATAAMVVDRTFRIVAEHALLAIQDEVTELERQGARTQASKPLTQVQGLVEQTQKLLSENHNREAADLAARSRAYLENVKQELARRAVEEKGEAERLIRGVEGGASPRPAAGGHASAGREYPGGSDLNNKEMMLSEQDVQALSEPRQLAQAHVGPVSDTMTGNLGSASSQSNRAVPGGTFMHDLPQDPGALSVPGPGEPTGAIIGTRPEPVVPTTELPTSGGSQGSYETPTGPGPFIATSAIQAVPGAAAMPLDGASAAQAPAAGSAPDSVRTLINSVEQVLSDEQRLQDIRRFQPTAVESARAKVSASSQALVGQQYMKALELAQQAQRIILEAERQAAKSAANENLQKAADRINLSEAAGAIMFAPAELTESIGLYEQAEQMLDRGDYLAARDISARALTAADDARLYNVNKARDMASLSTRYGGWKNASPLLKDAEQHAYEGEQLLGNSQTAAQGQEIAKRAVAEAQLALDHARDFTFQERIDNIYKALNTANRAGANYFNVTDVKRLIAELAVARDEYCTRNFDAVELKLKDIEVRLARVIETTPLVLEENLTELTEKLNAMVAAGAENWMAQEVDDVKSLMNRSAIDFRKHDYYSSYTNIKNAMKLADQIELRLQEQVYYDSVTELFAQLDMAFHNFEGVLNYDRAFLKKLVATPHGQAASISFAGAMSPNDFKDAINDIYLRAIHLKPPKSLEATHDQVVTAIKFAKVASENFQKLYILDQTSKPIAYDIIDTAFNQIERSKTLRGEIQVRLIEPEARSVVIRPTKIVNY